MINEIPFGIITDMKIEFSKRHTNFHNSLHTSMLPDTQIYTNQKNQKSFVLIFFNEEAKNKTFMRNLYIDIPCLLHIKSLSMFSPFFFRPVKNSNYSWERHIKKQILQMRNYNFMQHKYDDG